MSQRVFLACVMHYKELALHMPECMKFFLGTKREFGTLKKYVNQLFAHDKAQCKT